MCVCVLKIIRCSSSSSRERVSICAVCVTVAISFCFAQTVSSVRLARVLCATHTRETQVCVGVCGWNKALSGVRKRDLVWLCYDEVSVTNGPVKSQDTERERG